MPPSRQEYFYSSISDCKSCFYPLKDKVNWIQNSTCNKLVISNIIKKKEQNNYFNIATKESKMNEKVNYYKNLAKPKMDPIQIMSDKK